MDYIFETEERTDILYFLWLDREFSEFSDASLQTKRTECPFYNMWENNKKL